MAARTVAAAERSAVRAPDVGRAMTRWTTTDLEVAEALTNGGHLQRAADLCWALLGDGRVRAALETRTRGLLRLPVTWEESGDRRSSGRVAKALASGDFALAHSEAALCAIASWGILLGVGLGQRVWEERNGRLIGVLRPFDARHLRWDTHRRVWVVRTSLGDVDIERGSRRWVLYAPSCSGWPDGDEKPWLYGAWRGCSKPWLGKDFAWGDWQHHGEVYGSPTRIADVEEINGDVPDQPTRDDAANTLANLAGNASAVLAPGLKARMLEAKGDGWPMFQASINTASAEIAVTITGQTSSTEVAKGQDTGSTLHGKVRQDLIDGDGQTMSTFLHDQSIADYAAVNFGDAELAPWPKYHTEPPANVKGRGEAMKALGEGITALDAVAPEGKRVDRARLFEEAGIALEDAPTPDVLTAETLPSAAAALIGDDGWDVTFSGSLATVTLDGEALDILLAAGVTNFPAEGDDLAVSLRNSAFDRVPLAYALALRDDHPDVWAKGGNVLGNRQFARLLPVVRRGGRPETPTEELAVRLREAWCARHSKAGTGATIAGAVAAVKWWSFLNRPEQLRRVIADATSKDTRR